MIDFEPIDRRTDGTGAVLFGVQCLDIGNSERASVSSLSRATHVLADLHEPLPSLRILLLPIGNPSFGLLWIPLALCLGVSFEQVGVSFVVLAAVFATLLFILCSPLAGRLNYTVPVVSFPLGCRYFSLRPEILIRLFLGKPSRTVFANAFCASVRGNFAHRNVVANAWALGIVQSLLVLVRHCASWVPRAFGQKHGSVFSPASQACASSSRTLGNVRAATRNAGRIGFTSDRSRFVARHCALS